MDKIIVTGSSGFIGFSLAKHLLENGFYVIGIDKHDGEGILSYLQDERHRLLSMSKNYTNIRRDLSENIDDLETCFADARCVIHLAATAGVRESNRNPHKYTKNNVVAFSNVIELAKRSKIQQFIFASSSSVYGELTPQKNGFSEDEQHGELQSFYAHTKLKNEMEAFNISQKTKMKITGLRFFSVYGPYCRPDMAPWIFANSILNGLPTPVYGNGLMRRDFTFIDDVVKSIHTIIEKERATNFEIYNIGCSSPRTVITLLKTIESALGKKAIIRYEKKDIADVYETFANMDKFRIEYGNHDQGEFETLENGILKFCDWFCKFIKNLDRKKIPLS